MSLTRRGFVGGLLTAGAALSMGTDPSLAATVQVADIAVIGGGVGGVAAALAAVRRGWTVILVEESTMLGGQFTAQLVPPDEHHWIEPSAGGYGQTATYAELRKRVRDSYKRSRPVTAGFMASNEPNPGNAWASRLSAEPLVWLNRINDLLAPYISSGRLRVLYEYRPVGAAVRGSRVARLAVANADGVRIALDAKFFIDSTELGDLLPVVRAGYVIGREAANGELHNMFGAADPDDQQAFTWVAAVGYDPDGDYRLAAPPNYAAHRPAFDAFFTANLFDPTREYSYDAGPNFWQYRRVIAKANFKVPIEEVSLLNFTCNDYLGGSLLGVSDAERDQHLADAKNLTACLVHYLQNDIVRKDRGGTGYPGLRLRPDISGTFDGYATRPYIREARRILPVDRVWEWHVGVEARVGYPTAAQFNDSVGTGHYSLDLHAGPKDPKGLWAPCYPYQIPLQSLIPTDRTNVLAGGKCLGVSHVTNGAYRLHPTEWSIGEAAGIVATCSLAWGITPWQLRSTPARMTSLRKNLVRHGVQLSWPSELRTRWQGVGEAVVERPGDQ